MSADDLNGYLTRTRATNGTAAIEDDEIRVSTVHVYPSGPEVQEYHTQENAANAANSLRACPTLACGPVVAHSAAPHSLRQDSPIKKLDRENMARSDKLECRSMLGRGLPRAGWHVDWCSVWSRACSAPDLS